MARHRPYVCESAGTPMADRSLCQAGQTPHSSHPPGLAPARLAPRAGNPRTRQAVDLQDLRVELAVRSDRHGGGVVVVVVVVMRVPLFARHYGMFLEYIWPW